MADNPVEIEVPMIQRDTLLLEGESPDAHRYTWFYDPKLYPGLQVSDRVNFICCETLLMEAIITGFTDWDAAFNFCTAINKNGFRWIPKDVAGITQYIPQLQSLIGEHMAIITRECAEFFEERIREGSKSLPQALRKLSPDEKEAYVHALVNKALSYSTSDDDLMMLFSFAAMGAAVAFKAEYDAQS